MGNNRMLAVLNALVVGVLVASTMGLTACATVWAGLALLDAPPALSWPIVGLVAGYFAHLSFRFARTAWKVEIEGNVTRVGGTDPAVMAKPKA